MTNPDTAERVRKVWRKLCCLVGKHRLFVIGSCGIATQHIGCRDCYQQWGMNHDVRAFLPWSEVADFHIEQGYDPAAASRARSQPQSGETA